MTEHEDRSTDAETLPAGPVRRPGRELAAARERAGISFETMAEGLRLPKRQLEALEADDYASLPPPAYVRGYIRAYAREVGLDGDDIVALFDADHGDLQDPDLHPATPQGAAAGAGKGLPVGLAVIALVVVAGVGGWWWQGRPPADTGGAGETPSAAESTGQTTAGTATADGEAIAAADAGGGDATAEGGGDNGAGAGEDPGSRAQGARADEPGDDSVADAADAAGATATPTLPEPDEAASSQPATGPDDDAAAAGGDPGETATASAGDTADDATDTDATDTDATGSATAGDEDAPQDDAGGTAAGATDGERLAAAAAPEATGEEQDAADTDEGTGGQHDSPSATSDPGEAATPAAAVGPDTLELRVDGRSWVEVYDAGERELVYTLYLGSEPVLLRGWAPFDVFLGNSPAVTVVFNGQEVAKSAFTRSDNTARFLVDTDGARRR